MRDIIMRELSRLGLTLEVRDDAPSTISDVIQAFNGRTVKVWSGACDNTIFIDPHVNRLFRAWHDACHVQLNADFSLQGEKRVAAYQAARVGSDYWARAIMAEVAGQAEYFYKFGVFPANQLEFTLKALRRDA